MRKWIVINIQGGENMLAFLFNANTSNKDHSTHQGKCQLFKNFPGWDLEVNYPSGRQRNQLRIIKKSNEVNWRIYCTDLKSWWLKNTQMAE